MHLDLQSGEQLGQVQELLRLSQTTIMDHFYSEISQPNFEICGVNSFEKARVVYASVKVDPKLEILRAFVRAMYDNFKSYSNDNKRFEPHITLLKFKEYSKTVRQIQQQLSVVLNEFTAEFATMSFGETIFESVELLSMEEKDKDGYYKCLGRLYFSDPQATREQRFVIPLP